MKLSIIIKKAYSEAIKAKKMGEVPVGAVVFNYKGMISSAHNLCNQRNDPLAHAEVIALKNAAKKLNNKNLNDYMLYVTLEPCCICSFIISKYKINTVYFGAYDVKNGSLENGHKVYNTFSNIYKPKVYGGIGQNFAEKLIGNTFKDFRKQN